LADLPAVSTFPFVDAWRLAILKPTIAQVRLTPLVKVLASNSKSVSSSSPCAHSLRYCTWTMPSARRRFQVPNCYYYPRGAQKARAVLTSVIVQTLLHHGRLVPVAAASLAFNVGAGCRGAAFLGSRGKRREDGIRADEEDGEWEVELVSPVAEALADGEESENAGEL
jgi:PUL domain